MGTVSRGIEAAGRPRGQVSVEGGSRILALKTTRFGASVFSKHLVSSEIIGNDYLLGEMRFDNSDSEDREFAMSAVPPKPDPILLDLPEVIAGERIVLRPWENGQGTEFFEAVEESREEAKRWVPFISTVHEVADAEKLARKWRSKWQLREDLLLAAWGLDSGRLIGSAGLVRNDWEVRAFEIGYWIRSSESVRGYGREAAKLMAQFCFEQLAAERVVIRVAADNARSWAIPEAIGFVLEGVLRRSMTDCEGNYHDVKTYSLIRSDWEEMQPAHAPS